MTNRIVVGVDSTPGSLAALRWAFAQASRTGHDLTVVHVIDTVLGADLEPRPKATTSAEESQALVQARTLAALPTLDSDVRVTISSARGPLVTSLAAAARGAAMIVIGAPHGAAHIALLAQLDRSCEVDVIEVDADGNATAVSAGRRLVGTAGAWHPDR